MIIERYTLPNGIPLFIVESHSSPVVSVQAWVTRGSVHESGQVAGISHFLEHALFKGTRRRKVGELAKEIESRGGEINAFTSFEETAFYATLASRYFVEGLDVIADLLQNPLFDKEEMLREREVILEEIKRAHDSPHKMVSMNLWQGCFPNTPFGRPVLGFEKTVRKIDHRTLRQYFQKNYNAGTVALFIVGDVEKEKAFETARKKFGRMKGKAERHLKVKFKLPFVKQPKFITLSRDVKDCQIHMGIPVARIGSSNTPALDLMCSAIGQGESSRLYQRVVKEKRLAHEAHLGLSATSQCGIVSLGLMALPENLTAAVAESLECLREIAESGVLATEVERVKTSLESEVIGGKETVEGYARRLGYYFAEFGDPEYEGKYLQSLLAVDRDRATLALREILERAPVFSIVHPEGYTVDKKALTALFSGDRARAKQPAVTKPLPHLEPKGTVRFITKRLSSLPTVALKFLFLGGSREETVQNQGVANLFGRLWTSGTPNYDSLQIAHLLESLGASIHGFAGKNTCGISVEFLSKHWGTIKPLLRETLTSPTFPAKEFDNEKELISRDIATEKDSPGGLCQINFLSAIYGDHPYGRSQLGTMESLHRLGIDDVKHYYRSLVHRGNLVICTVGDVDEKPWLDELSELIRDLPESGQKITEWRSLPRPQALKIICEKKTPLFQSHILVGFLGSTFRDPERYALKLLSSALAGQGGRLFLELRDRQSLAYTVSPLNSDSPEPGIFGFYIGCSPEKLKRSLSGIRLELDKILDQPISERELQRAKEYWLGRFELDMQRYSSQSMIYGLDELYGLGFQHSSQVPALIKALTAKDIQAAARKFLNPEQATISVVHNEKLEEAQIQEAWTGVAPNVIRLRPGRPAERSL